MKKRIAVLPGDGIGPEIVAQAALVLDEVAMGFSHEFILERFPIGGCAIDATGDPFPEATLEACRNADAVLLGAVGGPRWDHLAGDRRPEHGLLRLRRELGLFANLRPATLAPALKDASPLRPDIVSRGVDILIVRELTGGIYFGHRGTAKGFSGREAFDTESYNEEEIRRIARVAFGLSLRRRRAVTSVDKANVLESSRLWRTVVTETASEYPDVALDHMYVDNAAMQLIKNPHQFDVLLCGNLFGDILSDECAMLTGSLGLLPSASINETHFGLYEPAGGSAPDIAGKGIANPIAQILSTAMMLRISLGAEAAADAVEKAVADAIAEGVRTADIALPGQTVIGTAAMGDAIVDRVRRAS